MTIPQISALFSRIQVGTSTLQHRIVMAPLTRFRSINHVPNELVEEYYEQRAARPGTLLITEGTFIAPQAGGMAHVPGLWSEEQIVAWSKVFKKIHDKKSFAYVQIWALGRQAIPEVLEKEGPYDYVSASNIPLKDGGKAPRSLTKEEIKEYVQLYAQAAKNAVAAGADGVELHGANGYLPDQFLHANSNVRDDEYGGSIENRARFMLEIIDALIEAIGADRVGVRLSPWGTYGSVDYGVSPIAQWSYVVIELERRARQGDQLAFIHVVEPRVNGATDNDVIVGSNDFIRQIWTGILIRAGNMIPVAEEETEKDPTLLVALGRYFISNPDVVERLESNTPLTKYNRATFYGNDAVGYTDYKTARVAPQSQL
jgi:NADPH2 dehydrogenase